MGLKFTFFMWGRGFLLGFWGFIIDLFKLDKWVEPYVWQIKMPTPETVERDCWLKWREKLARGEALILSNAYGFTVLIGVGLGLGCTGLFLANELLGTCRADNPLGVPLAVLLGIPSLFQCNGYYSGCRGADKQSVPVGTILAFLMSIIGNFIA